ncbi:phosphotransferase [Umezawaea sp. NPDC059074]|uniref:phosphotransferase n=1 Tax=Umezawaea sp. NPDC059074 TaxID=3346716 RepID=UPI0036A96FAD
MTTRHTWDELPDGAKKAVEEHTGRVVKSESTPGGRNSELSETLLTNSGPVFCKGISTNSPIVYMHLNEIAVTPLLPNGLAPRLLWHVETTGWLLLGYEHLSGRHADLSPDSDHLPLVADALEMIGRVAIPPTSIARRSMRDRWAQALTRELESVSFAESDPWCAKNGDLLVTLANEAPSYMDGNTLIHSDLNPTNILVSEHAVVVDWAWWQVGAPWFDPAYLVIRLIAAGHTPQTAENWARQFDGYAQAPPEAITAFAASAVCMWERRFTHTAATEAARQWARHRLAGHGGVNSLTDP